MAMAERKMRIEVESEPRGGRPDAMAKRIIDEVLKPEDSKPGRFWRGHWMLR